MSGEWIGRLDERVRAHVAGHRHVLINVVDAAGRAYHDFSAGPAVRIGVVMQCAYPRGRSFSHVDTPVLLLDAHGRMNQQEFTARMCFAINWLGYRQIKGQCAVVVIFSDVPVSRTRFKSEPIAQSYVEKMETVDLGAHEPRRLRNGKTH